MIKKLRVLNGADVAPVTHFDTVAHGTMFEHAVIAACKHIGIEAPENVNDIQVPFLIGSKDDIYCIEVTDAQDEPETITEATETSEAGKVSHSFELEFTDSEEKGVLIDLLRDAVTETTGEEMKGGTLANFEAFVNKHDSKINAIVGQTKFNSFALTEDQNAAFLAHDIANGTRPDPNATKLEAAAETDTNEATADTTATE